MIEFGSDFNRINKYNTGYNTISEFYPHNIQVANGRQAIQLLIIKFKWKRIWIPQYYCWDIIESIKDKTHIEICIYQDFPLADDKTAIQKIPFKKGDVLLRMNYFGLRCFRSNINIKVPVIEDHSHDLIGEWALHSDADFCISSLRKTFPIAEGGIIWSPKKHKLDFPVLKSTKENEELARIRWKAMGDKSLYLHNFNHDNFEYRGMNEFKNEFRNKYILTEGMFNNLGYSLIDNSSKDFLDSFDIRAWYNSKKDNYKYLLDLYNENSELRKLQFCVLQPESNACNPFSFTIICKNAKIRDKMKSYLVFKHVYPAVLWIVPKDSAQEVVLFSERMLSIHCDGRYNHNDIAEMARIIFSFK